MNRYLVMLSIGPVQSMIAAARRSRDLWSGSWLLSELSKACAKSLSAREATLIFPYVEDLTLLDNNSDFSVGNKLQVVVRAQSGAEVHALVEALKSEVQERFLQEVDAALQQLGHAKDDIRQDIWDAQKAQYLEMQAAWAKIDDDAENGYKQAVQKVASTLAARKATRDFKPAATNPYEASRMIPKSSLDGAFETVLHKPANKLKETTRMKLSLSDSEQLDCLGVVKRLGFADKVEQFTPFTRIAAHAWIQEVLYQHPNFEEIKSIYNELVGLGVATRVKGNKDPQTGQSIYKDFAYDGQLLYHSRLEAAIEQWRKEDDKIAESLEELQALLLPIWRTHGEPYRYGAMLLADGDRMGELLDKATSLAEHQHITKALSEFAESVANTMRNYNGHCIYAGGDDVLGFVPLEQAYACSKQLSVVFADKLASVSKQLGVNQSPTLSVGVAVCHIMTPMNVIRDLAKQSEKLAKGDHLTTDLSKRRNALNVLLSVRSGADISVRYQWTDTESLDAFKQWISLYVNKSIPSRVAYDIRDIHLRTQSIAAENASLHSDIRSAELKRMLMQARTATGDVIDAATIDALKARGTGIGLDILANELIVARWFAAKTQQELGRE